MQMTIRGNHLHWRLTNTKVSYATTVQENDNCEEVQLCTDSETVVNLMTLNIHRQSHCILTAYYAKQ